MTYHPDHIEALNDLIEINRDRAKGYERAVQDVTTVHLDSTLQSFQQYKKDSEDYIQKLSQHVRDMGGTPETSSSAGGAIHRAWIDIKTALSSHETESALGSCIYGDDAAIKAYESAMESDNRIVDQQIISTLNRQVSSIRSARHANIAYQEMLEVQREVDV